MRRHGNLSHSSNSVPANSRPKHVKCRLKTSQSRSWIRYGDDAYGWEMLPTAHKAALPQVKWIMPSAPLDELVGMRSWFDISDEAIQAWKKHGQKSDEIVSEPTQPVAMPTNVTKPNEEDPLAAFIPAIRYIHSLIDAELKTGIPSHRIAIVVSGRCKGAGRNIPRTTPTLSACLDRFRAFPKAALLLSLPVF